MAQIEAVTTLNGSEFYFEDITQAENWVSGYLKISSNAGTLVAVESTAGLENAMAIEIKGSQELNGKWFITNQNGEELLNEFIVVNANAENLTIDADQIAEEVEIRIIEMSKTCKITGGSLNLGSVNTNSLATNCGTVTYSSSKENGTLQFNFVTDFTNLTQKNLFDVFDKDYQKTLIVAMRPANNAIQLGWEANITAFNISFDDPFSSDCTLQLLNKTADVYIPEE